MAVPALVLLGADRRPAPSRPGWSSRSCSPAAPSSPSTTRRGRRSSSRSSAPTASSTRSRSTASSSTPARIVGPALAGLDHRARRRRALLRASTPPRSWRCSIALRLMDPTQLQRAAPAARAPRPGPRRACATCGARPSCGSRWLMMVVVGTLSFNFQVLLPLLADFTWHGTATTYALLTSAMGVGSVGGALRRRRARRASRRGCSSAAAALFGVAELLAAAAPTLAMQIARAGAARRRQRHVRRRRQLVAAARRRAGDARPRDGALLGRLPRLDADRRAADRLAGRGRGTARRARRRRRRGARHCRMGARAPSPTRASTGRSRRRWSRRRTSFRVMSASVVRAASNECPQAV